MTEHRRNFDNERYRKHFRNMLRVRAFEQAALEALKQGLVHGAIHPSIGQEAVAAGVCSNLNGNDILLSTHRGHGHTLLKGADPVAMMCELFGKEGGTCHGKGGSMHIADFAAGMLGANGVVGANIAIAAGAAHALRLRAEAQTDHEQTEQAPIVVCIFGDGAVNRGPFLEGLNWAKIYQLPILFVCEDNGFAATTRSKTLTAGAGPAARAESLGIAASAIDGNDIVAVDEITRQLIEQVRSGAGPRFLLAKTYRLSGHTGADPAPYRPQSEVAENWRNDPISRCEALLIDSGIERSELQQMRAAAQQEMQAAFAAAADAPWPERTLAYADVQDTGNPAERAY